MKKVLTCIVLLLLVNQSFAADDVEKVSGIPQNVKSAKAIIPIYSQKLAFKLPTTWKVGFQDQKPNMFMMEFIPKNEDINAWQNLLTIQGFQNLSNRVTAERYLTDMGNRFKSMCGNDFIFENLGTSKVDGFDAHRGILGCSKVPNQDFSEVAYWLVIQGKNDIYVVQKAIRSKTGNPLSSSNIENFVADISPIELCNAGGEKYECNK